MLTNGAARLRELERAAKAAKRGMWHSYVPPPISTSKLSDNFVGALFVFWGARARVLLLGK